MLDRNSALPLNYQLSCLIKDDITSGRRKAGDKLPTVRELTAQYKVSMPVVRQALAALQKEGLIELLHGKGAFVTEHVHSSALSLKKVVFLMKQTNSLRTHYYMRVLSGVEKAATRRQIPVEFIQISPEQSMPDIFREMPDSSAFIRCGEIGEKMKGLLEARNAVTIQIGDDAAGIADIINDDFSGGYQVGNHFNRCGYKKCAVFMREIESRFNRERLDGFRQAMLESGQNFPDSNVVVCGPHDNLDATLQLLLGMEVDAIFATTDRLANLVLQTAGEYNIKVPKDLGLCGFDNDLFSGYLNPPLTTVNVDITQLGEDCLRLLEQKLSGEQATIPIRVGVKLLVRESCSPVIEQTVAQ